MVTLEDTFIELSCSFDASQFFNQEWVSSGEDRNLQYVSGLRSFFQICDKYLNNYNDIYILDNTLKDKLHLDKRILSEIPNGVNFIFSNQNKYGRLNKGAGNIEGWNHIKDIVKKYKYFFHYEPRLKLRSPKFIESFLKTKKNTFIQNQKLEHQFQTGAFIIESDDLMEYLEYRTPESLCHPPTCIEDDLCRFFKKIKNKDFTSVLNPGMLWHDAVKNSWVEYL